MGQNSTGLSSGTLLSDSPDVFLSDHRLLLLSLCVPALYFFPESVWAKGSSNSGVCQTFSHLHIFKSSHLLILTSSHLHILTSSPLLILTSAHLRIFIFTSSYLHTFSSSHPQLSVIDQQPGLLWAWLSVSGLQRGINWPPIQLSVAPGYRAQDRSKEGCRHNHWANTGPLFTSSSPHIFSSSHRIFTSSHLHILSSSHLHILTSTNFTSSPSLLPSCWLLLFLFVSWRRGAMPPRRHETQPFRTKRRSIAKNWSKIALLKCPRQPFRTKWGSIAKNWSKITTSQLPPPPFAWNEVIAQNWKQ